MDATILAAASLRGGVIIPPDKAACHRAVIAAALASGETELSPWPESEDCQRTLAAVTALGARVARQETVVRIAGGPDALRQPAAPIDCGESGTTMRLLAGVLAGLPFTTTLEASPSLRRRPMQRIVKPLTQMGAVIEGRRASGSDPELYPPLVIRGRRDLTPIRYEMPVASAQVKSAILLAGLAAQGRTTVIERIGTRDHTERTLRAFGVRVESKDGEVSVEPGPLTSPGRLRLPGDPSSAAFFAVAACCVPESQVRIQEVGLNTSRLGFLRVLQRMGGELSETLQDVRWEPRGVISIKARPLHGVTVEPGEVPGVIDELPVLMVAAACAEGVTRFRGIGELRVKETDRVQSMLTGLTRMGARVRLEADDALCIEGGPLTGADVDSAGDHRTAMSLAVAGLLARGGPTRIRGAECVAKSFPEFFDLLRRVAGARQVLLR